jgi:hypothetical protein
MLHIELLDVVSYICLRPCFRKWQVRTSTRQTAAQTLRKFGASTSTRRVPVPTSLALATCHSHTRHPAQQITPQTSASTFSLAPLSASSINAPSANPAHKLFGKRAKMTAASVLEPRPSEVIRRQFIEVLEACMFVKVGKSGCRFDVGDMQVRWRYPVLPCVLAFPRKSFASSPNRQHHFNPGSTSPPFPSLCPSSFLRCISSLLFKMQIDITISTKKVKAWISQHMKHDSLPTPIRGRSACLVSPSALR